MLPRNRLQSGWRRKTLILRSSPESADRSSPQPVLGRVHIRVVSPEIPRYRKQMIEVESMAKILNEERAETGEGGKESQSLRQFWDGRSPVPFFQEIFGNRGRRSPRLPFFILSFLWPAGQASGEIAQDGSGEASARDQQLRRPNSNPHSSEAEEEEEEEERY